MKIAKLVDIRWKCPVCGKTGFRDKDGVHRHSQCHCWRSIGGFVGARNEDGVEYVGATPKFETALRIIKMCDYGVQGVVRYGTRIGFVLADINALLSFVRNAIRASSRPGVYRFDPPFNPVVTVDTEDIIPLAELYEDDWVWKNKLEETPDDRAEDESE